MTVFLIGILAANAATAGRYIESVSHEISGDEIEITVVITNPGPDDLCRIILHVKRGSDGEKIRSKLVGSVDAGDAVIGTISSNWDYRWNVHDLAGGYIIELEDYYLGVIEVSDIMEVSYQGKPVSCACSCNGVLIESPVHEDDYGKCPELCSKQCAGFTVCGRAEVDCGPCCSSYCKGAGLPIEGEDACVASCKDACNFNSAIHGLINVIRYVAIAVAAVVLAICGLKFIISQDPESRRQAKRCFPYLIFAIVLIGIAQALIGLFYEVPEGPPAGKMQTTNIYIEMIGEEVVKCWESSTGGPDRVCTKMDVSSWEIYTVTEDDVKNYLDGIGRDDVKDKMNWKIGEGIDKYLPGRVCIKYDTYWDNEVFVLKQNQDVMCIDFSEETKQIGDAVVACWKSNKDKKVDEVCKKIGVSGWAPEVTVAEVNVGNYLVSLGEGDIKDKMNWKIGEGIDNTLGEEVCIKYDTFWDDEVFVMRESNPDCS